MRLFLMPLPRTVHLLGIADKTRMVRTADVWTTSVFLTHFSTSLSSSWQEYLKQQDSVALCNQRTDTTPLTWKPLPLPRLDTLSGTPLE